MHNHIERTSTPSSLTVMRVIVATLSTLLIAVVAPDAAAQTCWCEPEVCVPYTPPSPASWETINTLTGDDECRIAVVVDKTLYESFAAVRTAIANYASELQGEGHSVIIAKYQGTAAYLRFTLQSYYDQSASLCGAVFVGNLPYVLYEYMHEEYGWVTFPTDAYFMDMNGVWSDDDPDLNGLPGILDGWNDDQVEIWVSRVLAHNLSAPDPNEPWPSEHELIEAYFARDIAQRHTLFPPASTALIYIDDIDGFDTTYPTPTLEAMGLTFSSLEDVSDARTTKADYIDRVSRHQAPPPPYYYVHELGHGNSGGHGFSDPNGQHPMITGYDYLHAYPDVIGFTMMNCVSCNFTTQNFAGGYVAFNPGLGPEQPGQPDRPSKTLIVYGNTTATVAPIHQDALWNQVGTGACFGEGFKALFNDQQSRERLAMVLLGDGSLKAMSRQWDGEAVFPEWSREENWSSDVVPQEDDRVRIRSASVTVDVGSYLAPEPVWSIALLDGADLYFDPTTGLGLTGSLWAESPNCTITMDEESYLELSGSAASIDNATIDLLPTDSGLTELVVANTITNSTLTVSDNCAVTAGGGLYACTVTLEEDGDIDTLRLFASDVTLEPGSILVGASIDRSTFEVGAGCVLQATAIENSAFDVASGANVVATGGIHAGTDIDQDWTITDAHVEAGPSVFLGEWSVSGVADGETWSADFERLTATTIVASSLALMDAARIQSTALWTGGGINPNIRKTFPDNLCHELVYGADGAAAQPNVLAGGTGEPNEALYLGNATRIRPDDEEAGSLQLDLTASLAIASSFANSFVYTGWDTRGVDIIAEPIERDPNFGTLTQRIELISPATALWYYGNPLAFIDVPCHGAFRDLILPDWDDDPNDVLPTVMVDEYDNGTSEWSATEATGFFRNVYLGENRTLKVYTSDGIVRCTGTVEMDESANVYVNDVLVDTYVPAIQLVVGTIYGDWNGDCAISNVELAALEDAIRGGAGTYDPLMDYNCDGVLSNAETAAFLANMSAQPSCGGRGDKSVGGEEDEKAKDDRRGDAEARSGGSEEPYVDVPGLAEWLARELSPEELARSIEQLSDAAVRFAGTPVGEDLADLVYYLRLQ